jgi:hypothetical protein
MRYYSSLSEVAEKRRQRAEWRIKRMNLQEGRLDLVSNDTEPVQTVRSPNNNEDLQDVNSNLSRMNVLNEMDPEETSNSNADARNITESVSTFTTNSKTKITDLQSEIDASDRGNGADKNGCLDACLTQETGSEMLPPRANILEQVSNDVEQNKGRDEQIIEVVSII